MTILFVCHTYTYRNTSKTALELDTSDEGSIVDHDQEGMVSDQEGSGARIEKEREEDSDEDTHITAMPDCPSMGSFTNDHDASESRPSAESALEPIADNDTFRPSALESIADNDDASAMRPSNESYGASTIDSPMNSYNPDTLEMDSEPFFLTSELTRAGRRRKCRDMSGLSLCLCGVSVRPDSMGSIQCQRAGCETVWVSYSLLLSFIRV